MELWVDNQILSELGLSLRVFLARCQGDMGEPSGVHGLVLCPLSAAQMKTFSLVG